MQILEIANQNANQLYMPEILKSIDFILKVNTRVAESVGYIYLSYLQKIFSDLLRMYGMYSQCISQSFLYKQNESMIKPMKTVRRDILKLIQTFIDKSNEFQYFNENFLPTLQGLTDDYQSNTPDARDPEVLHLYATMLKKMGESLSGYLNQILFNLCSPTLQVI